MTDRYDRGVPFELLCEAVHLLNIVRMNTRNPEPIICKEAFRKRCLMTEYKELIQLNSGERVAVELS
jgi:hypothetical protein